MSNKTRRIAVVGATASGKSQLAHEVAVALGDVELATVDSMTVYREMDLGTAKPSRGERAEVRYHLLDLVEPSEEFTVAQFQRAARDAVADVATRGRHLLYVGGTGLYGRAVLDDLEIPGEYPEIRAELAARAEVDLASLFDELTMVDPVGAQRATPSNLRRIVRALEVARGTGRPFSSFGPGLGEYVAGTVVQVGLRVDDAELDRRIDARLAAWMHEGLLDEARALFERTPPLSRTARQAVGYRQLFEHFAGACSLETALSAAATATRQLARRQRRWFQRDPRIEWFDDVASARSRLVELLQSATSSMEE